MSKNAVRNGVDNGNGAATKDDILDQLAECHRKISKTLELVSEKVVDNRKVIDDHELRIRKLEAQSRTVAQSQPVAQPVTQPAAQSQPVAQPAAQPAAQSQPVAQPATQQPVAQPAAQQPVAQPATKQPVAQSKADDNQATNPIINTTPGIIGLGLLDGPVKMYKYWDYRHKVWAGPKFDRDAAKAAGNGQYDVVWAWFKNGKLDRFLTREEVEEYCP
ncbi:hypothetical protein IJG22_02020 [Candidatus Saccharibacteria bacterium]|nr:hypothetical protein [Candidatus Saccharibacteria bacterium]